MSSCCCDSGAFRDRRPILEAIVESESWQRSICRKIINRLLCFTMDGFS